MNAKNCLLLISLLLPSFTYALSYQDAVVLAQEEHDKVTAEQKLLDDFYALDDYGTALKNGVELTGDVLINDGGLVGGTSVKLLSQNAGNYGVATLFGDGSFTYNINHDLESVKALGVGASDKEVFDYQVQTTINGKVVSRSAKIIITIIGAETLTISDNVVDETFYAFNDENSIVKNSDSVTGDVTTNDSGGLSYSLVGETTSAYGSLVFLSDGTYTYRLNNSSSLVAALGLGAYYTDTFSYQMIGVNKSVTANILIRIIGKSGSLTDEEEAAKEAADKAAQEAAIAKAEAEADAATAEAKAFFVVNDFFTVIKNESSPITVSGNVITNDGNVKSISLSSASVSNKGSLNIQSDGTFVYTVNSNASEVQKLQADAYIDDIFGYTGLGVSTATGGILQGSGTLTIRILSETYAFNDNVEIESNDSSTLASQIYSGQLIKGHLQELTDKDFYKIDSVGNEIIHLELCPQGNVCDQKNSWVLYVFDSDLFPAVENSTVILRTFVTDGTTSSASGTNTVSSGATDHLYLNYRANNYDQALIGVIDPCLGDSNSLDIGVAGAKTYYIAISNQVVNCDGGDMIQEKTGPNTVGPDTSVPPVEVSKPTTTQYFVIKDASTEQYSISVTTTTENPSTKKSLRSLNSFAAQYTSSVNTLLIPEIRVGTNLYAAELGLQATRTTVGSYAFKLNNIELIEDGLATKRIYSTYNPETNRVSIPVYTDEAGVSYSVDLIFHPAIDGQEAWLELIQVTPL